MNNLPVVDPSLTTARAYLQNASQAMRDLRHRIDPEDGQIITDIREAVEALQGAIGAVAEAVERLAELPS